MYERIGHLTYDIHIQYVIVFLNRGRHGRDHLVAGFTTTYAINSYHH